MVWSLPALPHRNWLKSSAFCVKTFHVTNITLLPDSALTLVIARIMYFRPPRTSSRQGRKHGHVRYIDFVKAMEAPSSPRAGGGGDNRRGDDRRKGWRAERRRRSSGDDIERLVDRLKSVGKENKHVPGIPQTTTSETMYFGRQKGS